MRNLRLVWAALCLVIAFGACGGKDGEELLAVWQVTSNTRNETSCDAEGPPIADAAAFIRFVEGEFFGQEYYQQVDCADASGSSCDEPAGLFGLMYAEPIDGGMRAEIFASSGTPESCLLSSVRSDAVVSGSMLRVETRRRVEENVTGTDCMPEDAEARRESMPCVELEILVGVRQ